ncbi:hypothetical protein EV122DRAFT_286538 [Schizophyllum commune]
MSTALVRAVELAFPDPTIKNVFSAYLKEAGFDAFRLPFGDGKAALKDKAVTETTTEVTETAHDAREKGFEGSWQSDAVAAFERAMDKHPNDDREITGIIRQLRVKYWEEKPKDVYVRCRVCSCCGRLRPVHELEAREARAAVEGKENDQHEMDGHDEAALVPVKRALTLLRVWTKY